MTNSPGHAVPLCSSTLAYQAAHSSAFKAPAAICHVYSMKSYGAMAPGSTRPSAMEKHMCTGRRMKGFRLGSSSALRHHRSYLPWALTRKQQEQQCRSQAPSSSAAISESIFPFLSVKHPLKMTVHDVSLLSQLPYGT